MKFDSFFEKTMMVLDESSDQMDLFAWAKDQEEKKKAEEAAKANAKPSRAARPVHPKPDDTVSFNVSARPGYPDIRDISRDRSLDWKSESTDRTFTGFSMGAVPGSFRLGGKKSTRPIDDAEAFGMFGKNGRIQVVVASTRGVDPDEGKTFASRSDLIVELEKLMNGGFRPPSYSVSAKVCADGSKFVLVAPIRTNPGLYKKNYELEAHDRELKRAESAYGDESPYWV